MKVSLLATGIRYQYENAEELHDAMTHLDNDRPEVYMVRKITHDYGVEVEIKEGMRLLAKVSRFDVMDVLELMRQKGFAVLKGTVGSVCHDGGWFTVIIEAPDDFVSCKTAMPDCWKNWALPNIPLMVGIPDHDEAESYTAYLYAALHCSDEFDVTTTIESLAKLIALSRYDVTLETQIALKDFRRLVDKSPEYLVHAMHDKLIHAINEMGSSKRQEEFEEVFYQSIIDSDEASDMINAWYSSFAYTKADDITLEEIRRNKLREIEHCLQALPYDLYREVDRKGKLLHLLLYKGIPYETYRALMSALVMRDHLLDELETVLSFSCDDNIEAECNGDYAGPLDTPEAMALWRKAQAMGWVDEDRQHLLKSQKKAAILASVIADILCLKPCWAPFERLWCISDLANKFSQAKQCSYYPDTSKEYRNTLICV